MFNKSLLTDGIYFLTHPNNSFEQTYIDIRKKEGNLLTTPQILALPNSERDSAKWKMRKASADLFIYYLQRNSKANLLEIGCGNGWFCNYISAKTTIDNIVGLDVNQFELTQAKNAFSENKKITWVYADIFTANIPENKFDVIVLNGSVQYFQNFDKLIKRLKQLLTVNGEIHILDSPFYHSKKEQAKAHEKTVEHYSSLGHPKMAAYYTPHLWQEANKYSPTIMYKQNTINSLLRRIGIRFFIREQNPFCWIMIHK